MERNPNYRMTTANRVSSVKSGYLFLDHTLITVIFFDNLAH